MRSNEERRQQNIPKGAHGKRAAVKLQGYAWAPSSSSAQIVSSSREDQNELLEKMLGGDNLRLAYKRVAQNGGAQIP
jgi:RNA-directed DNA polymerase